MFLNRTCIRFCSSSKSAWKSINFKYKDTFSNIPTHTGSQTSHSKKTTRMPIREKNGLLRKDEYFKINKPLDPAYDVRYDDTNLDRRRSQSPDDTRENDNYRRDRNVGGRSSFSYSERNATKSKKYEKSSNTKRYYAKDADNIDEIRDSRRNGFLKKLKPTNELGNNTSAMELSEDLKEISAFGADTQKVFGIYPVLLALRAKRRDILAIYCKTNLERTNPLITEILQIAQKENIPFNALHGKMFKTLFTKDHVHQNIFCIASELSLDVFSIETLDDLTTDCSYLREAELPLGKVVSQEATALPEEAIEQICNIESKCQESSSKTHTGNLTSTDKAINPLFETNFSTVADVIPSLERSAEEPKKIWILIDRVVDAMNMGAVLRSCCYFGVSRVLLTSSW